MRIGVVGLALVACPRSKGPEEPAPAPEASPARRSLELVDLDPASLPPHLTEPAVTGSAVLDGVEVPVRYHLVYRSGEEGFGQVFGFDGTPVHTCADQDFNSLLPLAGGRAALVSHFECVPGGAWVTTLDRAEDGVLTPASTRPVSWDALGGLWFPCSGQVSPWGTHLGSEEYEPDARSLRPDGTLANDPYGAWADLLKLYPTDPTRASPYRYGWATEIRVDPQTAEAEAHKRYALGRFSHELSYVLPDQRTVYQSDDGTGSGWFLFVADQPGDLRAGALYAARFNGDEVGWVPLGRATEAEVAGWIESGVRFTDLFEAAAPSAEHTCAAGFRYVHTANGRECLKLAAPSDRVAEPGKAASRLETRRYAAYLGATTELEKAEGVTFDPASGRVFLSVSSVARRTLAEEGEPTDDLRLPENPCGLVLGFSTSAGVHDSEGNPIDSGSVAVSVAPVLAGVPEGDRCAADAISNPDNLTLLPGYGLLMVAEDTRRHDHALLWAHDLQTGRTTRVVAAPPGGEVTGIHWIPDLHGLGYLTLTIQHPWGEGYEAPPGVTPDPRGFTGYLGPFPLAR